MKCFRTFYGDVIPVMSARHFLHFLFNQSSSTYKKKGDPLARAALSSNYA